MPNVIEDKPLKENRNPAVSVIIVTWNCASLLIDCLVSLQKNAGGINYEVIVVDNASGDSTLAVLAERFPDVTVLANEENLGFSKANNQGMAMARAPLLCLLNPDTRIDEADFLQRMQQRMQQYPEIGAAGCRLLFADGRHQVGDAGFRPTLATTACHALFFNRLWRKRFKGIFLVDGSIAPPYGRVGWVCGACMMIRKEVFDHTGGFDESYFLYGEDVEWGCRMNETGILVAYFPDISLIHIQGGTQANTRSTSTRWIDGVARLYFEYSGGRHWGLFKSLLVTGFALRAIAYAVIPGNRRHREMLSYGRHSMRLGMPDAGEESR